MNTRNFFAALLTLSFLVFSCAKPQESEPVTPVTGTSASVPDGSRIVIHFGTSTQRGCLYSFSNCIWIGWGTEAINADGRLALRFDRGDEASRYFGQYFPLTADYTVDAATAEALGIGEQVIPAGFYPLREEFAIGQEFGKMTVQFQPQNALPVQGLVNPGNPQDNLGQLHNLAVQVVLHENAAALQAMQGDREAIRRLIVEKTTQFLADAELPVTAADQQRMVDFDPNLDYGNYAARLDETHLSARDKKTLLAIFDEAAAIPVRSPEDLNKFVAVMTGHENRLAGEATLDNPKMVLTMLSVLKYSRYFWFWKSVTAPAGTPGSVEAGRIPDWVWADIIGMELGGPLVSAVASVVVYLDTH